MGIWSEILHMDDWRPAKNKWLASKLTNDRPLLKIHNDVSKRAPRKEGATEKD